MARFRKIDQRIWNDEKFRDLSDHGKLVFFLILTHPHMTSVGAMRATASGLAEELGWELEAFREAFGEVLSKAMAKHDEKACLIALPNFLRYNKPESPNVVKAWESALDLLPECALKNEVIHQAKGYAEGLSEAFGKALPEAFAKALPYQEQKQEKEPKQTKEQKKQARGTRLPSDWKPSPDLKEWAQEKRPDLSIEDEAEKFRDYWTARAGKDATKLDWEATFRNWIRNARGSNRGGTTAPELPDL